MRSAVALVVLCSLGRCLVACGDGRARPRLHGPLELVLLHTADTHATLFPYRTVLGASDERRGFGRAGELRAVGGFARLATQLGAERARARRVLHLDAGDLFQGSLAFERFGGEPELRAFDALGVEAQALGNHELDHGAEPVARDYASFARFPLLAVNYGADGSGGLTSVVEPFVVLDAGGLRVGVVGVGNTASVGLLRERPNELGALGRDAAESVQGALDFLRPLVDVVVVVTHLGLDADLELVERTSGIDVVLGGHQHLTLDEPQWTSDCAAGSVRDADGRQRACSPRRVPVVHSGAYTKTFGRVTLALDDEPSKLGATYDPLDGFELTALSLALVPVSDQIHDDPTISELLEPFEPDPAAALDAPGAALAFAPGPLERLGATGGDSPLGNFAAGVLLHASGAELAVLGASSLRRDVPPGLLDLDGVVSALPFEDPLVRVELSGATLGRALEHAARSASARDCRTQVHVAGMAVRFRCPCDGETCARVFATETDVPCRADVDCGTFGGACLAASGDTNPSQGSGRCFAPLDERATYRVATTDYLAGGGSGVFDFIDEAARFAVNDALSAAIADDLRGRRPCPAASVATDCTSGCSADALRRVTGACATAGLGFVCGGANACERAVAVCRTLPCLDGAAGAARDGRIRFEAP